jgi:hypothetical protein
MRHGALVFALYWIGTDLWQGIGRERIAPSLIVASCVAVAAFAVTFIPFMSGRSSLNFVAPPNPSNPSFRDIIGAICAIIRRSESKLISE